MAKRKRDESAKKEAIPPAATKEKTASKVMKMNGQVDVKSVLPTIQIVAGSYERILHGVTATLHQQGEDNVSPSATFADTFLFNAHASSIRCLALSPLPEAGNTDSQGVYLATGGSDEKINVYNLAASVIVEKDSFVVPTLVGNKVSENPRNRELGTLLQHSSNITALHFPTRSKLLSASEDNTISISRLKDLQVVSTIKAPRPKAHGQPSGDTAPPGMTPAGVNEFAIHPSMKLMLSVGRGEKCMRLWNLVTGKKAGVLNFPREILQSIKESKYSSGEGRRIVWNTRGTEFAVAFARGVIVFGQDSTVKYTALPQPLTKVHQIRYVHIGAGEGASERDLLAVSTEDGRVLFYSPESKNTDSSEAPELKVIAQLGGKAVGISGRIKDFEVLLQPTKGTSHREVFVVTANSEGVIRVWRSSLQPLLRATSDKETAQVGTEMGSYETGSRITCLGAFFMLPPTDIEQGDTDFEDFDQEDGSDEVDTSDSDN